jgi:outer membrane protein assembly factor BamB
MLHVVCADRKTGNLLWTKDIKPSLPETDYAGYLALHGYASSTPTTDGKHVYVFFGKTGVFCFDLNGQQIWQHSVGTGKHGWGSATSPILYKDTLIVNASVESSSLVALNKATGDQVWKTTGITESWSSPVLVPVPGGQTELVFSGTHKIMGFDPDKGDKLWYTDSFNWYVCPTVTPHNGVVYTLQNSTAVAVKCGGRGDVTGPNTVWQKPYGSTVSSFVYHNGLVYSCPNGTVNCLKADTGEVVYKKALTPKGGDFYASPLVAGDKIYFTSRYGGTYVVEAGPEFKQLAHNTFASDPSRTNASPIVDQGCLIMRTDQNLYCIGTMK